MKQFINEDPKEKCKTCAYLGNYDGEPLCLCGNYNRLDPDGKCYEGCYKEKKYEHN